MDHKPSKPDTDSWVDDRMARLDPSPEWKPDASQAFERLTQRKPSLNAPWMRLVMTSTILAATVLVLVLLPWQRLWTPKPVTTAAALAQTGPAASQQSEKPAEKAQENPTPKETAEASKQAPAVETPPFNDNIHVTPGEEGKLLQYLGELAKQRGVAPHIAAHIQLSQADAAKPQVLHSVLPEYSDEAREARIQGTIEMVITVKADGTVQFESFKKTLGHGLDEKAREAVEKWLFTPARKDGAPVATTITISTNFSLR